MSLPRTWRFIRAKGRLARVDAKRDEILEELHGAPALAAPASSQIVLGGRVIDADSLQASYADPMHGAGESMQDAPAVCTPPPELCTPARSRSDRTPADNYADWLAIEARLQAGEVLDEADARWHRMYPASAQYRAESQKRKAAA